MTRTFHNRHSYRCVGYDYASVGWYFITINTEKFTPIFGEIKNGVMHLNEFGKITHEEWLNTAKIRDYVTLEEHIVMPDHFHAIVTINKQENYTNEIGVFRSCSHTLGAIVRGFKGAVTSKLKKCALEQQITDLPSKIWQRNYYDRIIRDDLGLTSNSRETKPIRSWDSLENLLISLTPNLRDAIFCGKTYNTFTS